jgi:hypothetical protein
VTDREITVTPDMIQGPNDGDWTIKTTDEILADIIEAKKVMASVQWPFTVSVAEDYAPVHPLPLPSAFAGYMTATEAYDFSFEPRSTVRDRRPVTPKEAQKRIAKRKAQKRARKS